MPEERRQTPNKGKSNAQERPRPAASVTIPRDERDAEEDRARGSPPLALQITRFARCSFRDPEL